MACTSPAKYALLRLKTATRAIINMKKIAYLSRQCTNKRCAIEKDVIMQLHKFASAANWIATTPHSHIARLPCQLSDGDAN